MGVLVDQYIAQYAIETGELYLNDAQLQYLQVCQCTVSFLDYIRALILLL